VSVKADAEWALLRAVRYLQRGGDWATVEPFVDAWLDHLLELRWRGLA
jgi:hypothetical protein